MPNNQPQSPQFPPSTVLVGGMFAGEFRPLLEDGEILTLPSLDGSCAVDPDDCVCGEVRFDQFYHLKVLDIPLPSGVVCRYRYWCHASLVDTIDEATDLIPLEECHVERLNVEETDAKPYGPFISDGKDGLIGLN